MDRRTFLEIGAGCLAAGIIGGGGAVSIARTSKTPVQPPRPFIVGDSIGEGLRWASGELGDTKRGISIAGQCVLGQMRKAPPDSTLVISLGTNDAAAGLPHARQVMAFADRVIAEVAGRPLLWVGPPKPCTSWDLIAQGVDMALEIVVERRGGRYVSAYNLPGLFEHHAKDGIHFDLAGYRLLWEAVRVAL